MECLNFHELPHIVLIIGHIQLMCKCKTNYSQLEINRLGSCNNKITKVTGRMGAMYTPFRFLL